ncbi:MAG: DUF6456 domain-containing protein [Hyphomicrobium sp.]
MHHKKANPAPRRSEDYVEDGKPRFNGDESPLTWLARRKDKEGRPLIARPEFEAGEKLRSDYHFALLAQRVTASWSSMPIDAGARRATPGIGVDLADNVIAARERVNRALAAVGPELAGILIDVCCYLKGLEALEKAEGWPQRSGKIILQLALQRLARHYGLINEPAATSGPAKVRHWGAAGYKPRIEPE